MNMITPEIARRVVLEKFAGLTRHKPAALSGNFGLSMRRDGETVHLFAAFGGKRTAETSIPATALEWGVDRFGDEIAKPMAEKLLASALTNRP